MTRAGLEVPWLVPVVLAVVVVALVAGLLRRDRRGVTPVANTEDLRRVPALRAWRLRYGALRVAVAVAVAAAAVGAAVLAARPVTVEERTRELANRDIVLCLDVSGSMVEYGERVVATFERLVDGFTGERVALSLFDSTSATVFPLTDDYELVTGQLRAAREVLAGDASDEATEDLLRGTAGLDGQASLIGDGVASCVLQFDQHDAERSRSVVLATDNELWGDPVYTLPDAAQLAASRGVALYALFPDDERVGASTAAELRIAAELTGGTLAVVDDPDAVPQILARVQDSQLAAMQAAPERVVTDDDEPWVWLLYTAGLLAVVLAWRVRA